MSPPAAVLTFIAYQTPIEGPDGIVRRKRWRKFPFVDNVCRLDAGKWAFSLFPYGNKWRAWHKAFYAQV